MVLAREHDELDELFRGPFARERGPQRVANAGCRVQLVTEPQKKALPRIEHGRVGIVRAEIARLVRRQSDALPEEGDVDAPLVLGAAPEARSVDDDLSFPQRE